MSEEAKKSKEKAMAGMAKANKSTTSLSLSKLFLTFTILSALSLALYLLSVLPTATIRRSYSQPTSAIYVYVADIPPSLNYALLHRYWSSFSDSRLPSDHHHHHHHHHDHHRHPPLSPHPPYPDNPLIKQYSAEYWITADLITPPQHRATSFAKRVLDPLQADVVFVPFFATLSAEMQLGANRPAFRKKLGNDDYRRQRQLLDALKATVAWKRSGGRDHVFVLTDPVAMWHVKDEIAASVLLVVDFGGWYRLDSRGRGSNCSESGVVPHAQVSLLKDVIVPYTHLLPRLDLSENKERDKLLYFKGAKHRHRGGLIREKLWDLLINEPGVIMEEGFPNATGQEQSIKGMRTSEFCLHPAGDTPTSCRLFDAIQSLCIPVIVSDNIELPFEGMVDYSEFSLFVAVSDALKPSWLVNHLKGFSKEQKDRFRQNMARVQPVFVYDNGQPGGIGPIPLDGAVNHIWKKVHQKLPMIKEAIIRERRKPPGVSVPRRCHCT